MLRPTQFQGSTEITQVWNFGDRCPTITFGAVVPVEYSEGEAIMRRTIVCVVSCAAIVVLCLNLAENAANAQRDEKPSPGGLP